MAMWDFHLEQRLEQVTVAMTPRYEVYRALTDGNHGPQGRCDSTGTIILLEFLSMTNS